VALVDGWLIDLHRGRWRARRTLRNKFRKTLARSRVLGRWRFVPELPANLMRFSHGFVIKSNVITKISLNIGVVQPQLVRRLRTTDADCLSIKTGMVIPMCTTTISTLTLTALLRDPLIQLVMRSDNVSESDHSELLYRVKDSLAARCSVVCSE
jgi:hypothetical protein